MSVNEKLYKAILFVFFYFCIYWILTMIWGQSGYLAVREASRYANELEEHTKKLKRYQEELKRYQERTQSDETYKLLKARELGYYRYNEGLILINGWSRKEGSPSPGEFIFPPEMKIRPDDSLKVFATVASLIIVILSFLFDKTDGYHNVKDSYY